MVRFDPLNERLKKQYEEALLFGSHREARTVDGTWKAINTFEVFTNRKPFMTFNADQAIGFRQWLMKQPNEKGDPMSLGTIRAMLGNVREFFMWLHLHPKYGRKINAQAATYLRLSNNEDRAARASKPRQVPTLEQFKQAVLAMPEQTDVQKRDRALMAFLGITGMRDAALVSLRLKDVDIEKRTIWQDPKHVKTKFRKSIVTALVPIDPELERIVVDWLAYAKDVLGMDSASPVFPATCVEQNPANLTFENKGLSKAFWANAAPVRKVFREAFHRVGLPYFHPHTVRHMLVAWGMENLSQIEFKALSQNLGHEHAMTSYTSYGYIQPEKQVNLIRGIGKRSEGLARLTQAELIAELARRN